MIMKNNITIQDILNAPVDYFDPNMDAIRAIREIQIKQKNCSHQHVVRGICLNCKEKIDHFTGKVIIK